VAVGCGKQRRLSSKDTFEAGGMVNNVYHNKASWTCLGLTLRRSLSVHMLVNVDIVDARRIGQCVQRRGDAGKSDNAGA